MNSNLQENEKDGIYDDDDGNVIMVVRRGAVDDYDNDGSDDTSAEARNHDGDQEANLILTISN